MLKIKCAHCKTEECRNGKDCFHLREGSLIPLNDDLNRRFMKAASEVEVEGYGQLNRIQELMLFSKKMNFSHLGIAFCVGMSNEAEILSSILSQHFVVSSACCKICAIPKSSLSLPSLSGNPDESACNPSGQALALEKAGTELNIIMGLCLGHDLIFTRQSHAPVTTIVVKDRVLAHNPAGALYSNYHFRDEKETMRKEKA